MVGKFEEQFAVQLLTTLERAALPRKREKPVNMVGFERDNARN